MEADDEDLRNLTRRSVLKAAATAGLLPVGAVVATGGLTSDAAPSSVREVQLAVAGEPVDPLWRLNDLRVALEVVEDFFNRSTTAQTVGANGWGVGTSGSGASLTAGAGMPPGTCTLSTGTTSGGYCVLHLGAVPLAGQTVFTTEWRAKLHPSSALRSVWLGLHDGISATEPADGYYFHLAPSAATWHAKTASASTRTDVDTGVAADATQYHRFRITCDGASAVRFSVDDVECANSPITTNLPGASRQFGPIAAIRNSAALAAALTVDWFYLRWEWPR